MRGNYALLQLGFRLGHISVSLAERAGDAAFRAAVSEAETTCWRFLDTQIRAGADEDAYFGEARLAVWRAVERWDPRRSSMTFASYAHHTVKNALLEERRRQDHLSREQRKRLNEKQEQVRALQAAGLPVPPELLDEVNDPLLRAPIPLDADELDEGGVFAPADGFEGVEQAWEVEVHLRAIAGALHVLDADQHRVFLLRHVDGLDWKAVASACGASKTWAQERGREAVAALQKELGINGTVDGIGGHPDGAGLGRVDGPDDGARGLRAVGGPGRLEVSHA